MTSPRRNTAPSWRPMGLTEYPVLGALSLAPAHGYDLFRFLDHHLRDICRFGRSQTYAVLNRLEQEGMARHHKVDQDNLPSKKVFEITSIGEELLAAWVKSPVAHIRDLRVEFLVKLFFAGLKSSEVREDLLRYQLEVCRRKAQRLEELKAGCRNRIELVAIEYRTAIVLATDKWLKGLLEANSFPCTLP
ncbi:MAG: PadR family transcriptional regulator [Thermodesulfobacteriota bacterium]